MHKLTLTIAALVACLVTGCTSTKTATAKVHYKPKGQGALSSVKPRSVMIQVNDQRPAGEQDCVSKTRLSSIDPTFVFVTTEPATDIVGDALKKELEVNGHHVVSGADAKPDANITIGLKRFFGTLTGRHKVAEIDAEILVARENGQPPPAPFPISGNFKKTYNAIFAVLSADPSEELSAALADFIHNLTLDPRFLEALQ
jgi:hypothetical protein